MTRAALQAFKRTVTVSWPQKREAGAKAALIARAKQGNEDILREQAARAGIAPLYTAYANRQGNPVENVKLPGPIIYRYSYLREVVIVTLEVLKRSSPIVSGEYRNSHTLFVNGIAVKDVPFDIKATDDLMISNPVPYARRLEVGKTKTGRAFVIQVAPHIYERVALDIIRPQYRNVASVSFEYATLPDAYTLRQDGSGRRWSAKRGGWRKATKTPRDRFAGSQIRSPAIVISALQ